MGADSEAVRFVAHALEIIEHRALLIEPERRLAGNEEALAPCVAINAFGDAGDGDAVLQAQFIERFECCIELAVAAVDQHEIGPSAEPRFAFRLVALFGEIDAAVLQCSPACGGAVERVARD